MALPTGFAGAWTTVFATLGAFTLLVACDYNDPTSASVSPIEQMAAASAPAASKVPAQSVAKTVVQAPAKPVAVKVKQSADQKVAASMAN